MKDSKTSVEIEIEQEEENSFYDSLLYDLRFRHLSGKKLILAFEALELALEEHDRN
jgi:hypothetical protein